MEKGLYKKISDNELSFARNTIAYPDGTVITVLDHMDSTEEVHDSWRWFNTRAEALEFFNVVEIELDLNRPIDMEP